MSSQDIAIPPRWKVTIAVDSKTDQLRIYVYSNDGSKLDVKQSSALGTPSVVVFDISTEGINNMLAIQKEVMDIQQRIADIKHATAGEPDNALSSILRLQVDSHQRDLDRLKALLK